VPAHEISWPDVFQHVGGAATFRVAGRYLTTGALRRFDPGDALVES
jgi:hypothetical protein